MKFTNSPLVTYTNLTKNKTTNRNHPIDTITIHCYVGQITAKQGCDYFATTERSVSSNYVVGKDGSIGLSVEEKDRAWTSGGVDKNGKPIKVNGISGSENDYRAVTIEVACDTNAPYAVTSKAYKALINLVADICKRNNIKELKWKADKSLVGQVDKQNMTVHRWFALTECPGDYLYDKHSDIAAKVNAILNSTSETTEEAAKEDVMYHVQVGAYKVKANADAQLKKVKDAGFDTNMIQVDGQYKIQVGAYSEKSNADGMLEKLKAAGFNAFITNKGGKGVASEPEPVKKEVKVGCTVKVNKGAKTFTGGSLASFVYERNHQVKEVNVDRVVITYEGTVIAAVRKSDLTVID